MSRPPIVPPITGERCPHCLGGGRVIDQRGLGRLLRARRQELGHDLTTMALALDISKAYLSDLELGRRDWPDRLYTTYVRLLAESETA